MVKTWVRPDPEQLDYAVVGAHEIHRAFNAHGIPARTDEDA
jgi:hypothetical protein